MPRGTGTRPAPANPGRISGWPGNPRRPPGGSGLGQPYPLGATYDGTGTNFSLFSSVAEGVELCLFGEADGGDGARGADRAARGRRATAGTPTCPTSGPASATATGSTARGTRPRGSGATRPSCCSTRTPRRSPARSTGTRRASPTTSPTPPKPNTVDSAPHVPHALVGDPFFDWGNDRSPRHPMHETIIYEAHVRGMTLQPPGVPEELRGTYAGLAHPAVVEHLTSLGITAIELMPVHQFVHDHHLVERGLRNYWGYNSIAYLAPHNGYATSRRSGRRPQPRSTEFKAMVKTLHAAGIEVIMDVVYNHTAEGNHLGPTLSMRGIDNLAYYRVTDDEPALLPRLHRHRQQPQHAQPARAAADHGQPALLGDRDARRRVPLRPRVDAGPRAVRRRPAVGVLRPRPAGPGRVVGQADRRAVGRRRGRLPGRQLPAAVVGVERPLPRHDPRLLARRAGRARRVRLPLHGQLRPVPGRQPAPDGIDQLRHRPRRLHARRPRLVQREAQRGQRRGQPRRRVAQPVVELRRRGRDRRPGDRRPARPAAAQHDDDAAALPGRADDPRRRRARPHPARQQQRLLPGQRDLVVRLGADVRRRRSSSGAAGAPRCAARQPRVPPAALVPGPPDPRHRGAAVAALRRRGDDATTTGTTDTPSRVGVLLNGSAISTPDAFGGRVVDDSSCCCSTPASSTSPWTLSASALWAAPTVGRSSSIPRRPRPAGPSSPTARPCRDYRAAFRRRSTLRAA